MTVVNSLSMRTCPATVIPQLGWPFNTPDIPSARQSRPFVAELLGVGAASQIKRAKRRNFVGRASNTCQHLVYALWAESPDKAQGHQVASALHEPFRRNPFSWSRQYGKHANIWA